VTNKFHTAAETISRLFSSLENEKFEQADKFFKNWDTIVGERLSSHSKVLDVNKGCIIVEVDHPGWSQQLQFIKKRIIKELRENFPELDIKTLAIRDASVCLKPYERQTGNVGDGLFRRNSTQEKIEKEPSVEVDKNLDDPLKDVLSRLRESIKKGKPQ